MGDFRFIRLIKKVRQLETWLAHSDDRQLVVKLAPAGSDDAANLVEQAQALQAVQSAHVPRLVQFREEGQRVFLALQFIPGPTLREHLDAKGPLSKAEFYGLAGGALVALRDMHQAGFLHRDLKPDNLVLGPSGGCLVDFGFASRVTPRVQAGSVLYAAPEASGLIQRDVAETADLYSLGVLLFESLAGRPPFTGSNAAEALRQHLSWPVPFLPEVRPDLSLELQSLLEKLLAKEPDERYQSAEEALVDLEAWHSGVPAVRPSRRPTLAQPSLVGRQSELQRLREHLTQRGALLLTAPSGGGKSRLLEALGRMALARGELLLRGRAQVGGAPYLLLHQPLAELLCSSEGELLDRLRSEVLPWKDHLVQALPTLGAWLGPAAASQAEEKGHFRTVQALVALFEALGRLRPTVLLLDDVQWSDPVSQEVLCQLSRLHSPLTAVIAARSHEFDWDGPSLQLDPLSREASLQLVSSMTGPLPAGTADWLLDYAEGNPFLLVEGTRGTFQSGFEPVASSRAAGILEERLAELPAETRDVLIQGAILGRTFRLSTLALWSGRAAHEVFRLLSPARRFKLLWADAEGLRCTLAHDRILERLLQSLSPERRLQLHGQAATALEQDPQSDLFERADQYARSHRPGDGAHHALQAALLARQQCQFARAAEFYSRVLQTEPHDLDLREQRAQTLFHAGLARQALDEFAELSQLHPPGVARARCFLWMASSAQELGRLEDLVLFAGRALEALGQSSLLAVSAGRGASMLLRLLLRRWPPDPPQGPITEGAQLAVQCLQILGNGYFHSGHAFLGIYFTLRSVFLAEEKPTGWHLGWLWANYSSLVSGLIPLQHTAEAFHKRGVQLLHREQAQEIHLIQALVRSVLYRMNTETLGPLVDFCLPLQDRFMRAGDLWEWMMSLHICSLPLLAAGQFASTARLAENLRRVGLANQNPGSFIIALNVLARADAHCPEPGPLEQRLAASQELSTMSRVHLRVALGVIYLRAGRYAEAVEALKPRADEKTFVNDQLIQEAWWGEALRRLADTLPDRSQRKMELYRQARKILSSALTTARICFNFLLPRIERELGVVELALDHTRKGLALLRSSQRRALRLEHHYEEARSRLELALWREDQGEPAGAERRQALLDLQRMGAPWPVPSAPVDAPSDLLPVQAQGFARLLFWSRNIASSLDLSGLRRTASEAFGELLQAETCWQGSFSNKIAIVGSHGPVAELSLRPRRDEPGEGQRRLADFLARLTAAAWENAQRHAQLLERDERLNAVFRGAGCGLAVINSQGDCLQTNPRFDELADSPEQRRMLALPKASLVALRRRKGSHWAVVSQAEFGQDARLLSVCDVSLNQLEQLARLQETERRLLAAELHDGLLADLTALRLRLELAGSVRARQLVAALQEDLMGLVHDLPNPLLENRPFYSSVRACLQSFRQRAGVELRARLTEDEPPALLALLGYRILQIWLQNAHRLGRARRVEVSLRSNAEGLWGRLRDDGVPYHSSAARRRELRGVRLRVLCTGGRLSVSGSCLRFHLADVRVR